MHLFAFIPRGNLISLCGLFVPLILTEFGPKGISFKSAFRFYLPEYWRVILIDKVSELKADPRICRKPSICRGRLAVALSWAGRLLGPVLVCSVGSPP